MKCSRVRDSLMDYTSADLSPGELHRINEHLMDCEECRAALELARRASSALSMLGGEEPAPTLVSAVRGKIARDTRPARPVLLPRLAMGFSAAAVIALVVTGLLHHSPSERTDIATKPAPSGPTRTYTPKVDQLQAEPTPNATPKPDPARQLAMNWSHRPVLPKYGPAKSVATDRKTLNRKADPEQGLIEPTTPAAEQDTGSEPVMLIAVQPKEPEIYVMRLDAEEQEPATDLTVVREYDGGGNITSVTISGEASPEDSTDTAAPAVDRTQLLDAPPAGDIRAGLQHAGGSARNA